MSSKPVLKPTPLLILWSSRAGLKIQSKVRDAQAHGTKAVTEALKQTPDGRPTLRRARRSPSLTAGKARLDELLTDLAGPSVASRAGLLRDARQAFYQASFAKWWPLVPEDLRIPHGGDRWANVSQGARTLVLHGRDLRDELAPRIEAAKRGLASAVVLASSPHREEGGLDLLEAWGRSAERTLRDAVNISLGDDQLALDRIAGRDAIDPTHLDDSPLEF
jgi:hypothetical protein